MRIDPGLELPYPPSVNRTYRWGQGRMHKIETAKRWTELVQARARVYWREYGLEMITGRLCVWGTIAPPRSNSDMDNCEKILWDALQGIAYADDKQIARKYMHRLYGIKPPHVCIWVGSVDEMNRWIDSMRHLPLGDEKL